MFARSGLNSSRNRRERLFCISILAVVLGASALALTASDSIPAEYRLIAAVIVIIGCLPACVYIRDSTSAPVPMLALIGAYYVSAYGLPAFVDLETRKLHSFDTVTSGALIGALVAMCSLFVGFLLGRKSLRKSIRPFHLPVPSSEYAHKVALWLLVLLECATLLIPSINEISIIKQFIGSAGLGSYGVLFVLWKKHRLSKIEVAVLCLFVLPLEFVKRFATGMVADLVMPCIFLCLIAWAAERAIYWKTGLVVICGVALLNGVKAEYRMQRQASVGSSISRENSLQGARALAELAYDRYTNKGDSPWDSHVLERTSQIGFLAYVMDQTPAPVPYLMGASYLNLFVKPIPRFLWPGKPVEDAGYWFSAHYGMRSAGDYTTSFNLPWAVEAYANFGVAGLTLGMFAIGLIIGLFDGFLNSARITDTDRAFGIALIYTVAFQESNFSLVVGGIAPQALALYFYFSLWTGKPTRRSTKSFQAAIVLRRVSEVATSAHS